MGADNDIVESLLIWKTGPVLREHPGFFLVPEADIDKAAAEIVRLRGEVAPNVAGLVDNLIQLRDADWTLNNEPMPDDAQDVLNMAIEAIRNPAPTMPNGMEGLIDDLATALVMYNQSRITMQSLAGSVSDFLKSYHALRTADNRDAAGVAEEYDEGPTWTHDGKRISAVFSGDGKVGLVITANPGAVNGRIEFIGAPVPIPITPAAVPAGEANGDAPADVLEHLIFSVDRVANSGDYGLCDQAVVQLNCAIEDARRGIGTGTPQSADDKAVAKNKWAPPYPDAAKDPFNALLTTPPAPMQAAPQEGEAMDRGPWRRKGARFYSDDFTHDVSLVVGGDFGSDEVEDRYLDWLLSVLNGPAGAALQHRGDSRGGEE